MLLWLVLYIVNAQISTEAGCYLYDEQTPQVTRLSSPQNFTFNECLDQCIEISAKLVSIFTSRPGEQHEAFCRCLPESPYSVIVDNEKCNNNCTDGITCGGNGSHYSVYYINEVKHAPPSGPADSGQPQPIISVILMVLGVAAALISCAVCYFYCVAPQMAGVA